MSSGQFDFSGDNAIDQGATWKPTLNWYDTTPATPFDLTGWTGVLKIKETPKSDTVLLEASTTNNRITLGSTDPNIQINVPASATALLPYSAVNSDDNRIFVYDLFLTSPTTEVTKLIRGSVEVIASVS